MKNNSKLTMLIQLTGGTFPSGGFSQSFGLETYVANGLVNNGETFTEFAGVYIDNVIMKCEGPIACEAYRLAKEWDREKLLDLETLSNAVKLTKESREASLRTGKAVLRIMADVVEDKRLAELRTMSGRKGMTYPVVYGTICSLLDIDLEDSIEAFIYNTVNTLVQSGIKLIPLGNTEAQKIVFELHEYIRNAVESVMDRDVKDISNFCPALDIAGIIHEDLRVRLYMS